MRKSYWPELFVFGGLAVAAFLSVYWPQLSIKPNDFLVWFGSLTATFIGAWLAFHFNNVRAEKEKIQREIVAGNVAISTMTEFWDRQKQYQKEVAGPYRTRADAWLNMPVGMGLDSVDITLARSDLAFLLEKAPRVWQAVILEERRYRLLAKLIDDRQKTMLTEAWPKLVENGVQLNAALPANHVDEILGPAITQKLKLGTAVIIENTEQNVRSSWTAYEDLRAALMSNYPEKKFIKYVPHDTAQNL